MLIGRPTAAFTLGSLTMYFLDARSGARRRAILYAKAVKELSKLERIAKLTSVDVKNRFRGLVSELKSLPNREPPDDAVLEARVRAKLGNACSHPGAVHVSAQHGAVALQGKVLRHELRRVLRAARKTRGVKSVRNELEVHNKPNGIPDLQGGQTRLPRFELLQHHWAPSARLIVGGAGLRALALGAERRSLTLATVGGLLLLRALTNIEFDRLVGLGERGAIEIKKTIRIRAPLEEVFRFWENPTNFPRFMSHVKRVSLLSNGTQHWEVTGPGNTIVAWEAQTTVHEPNRRLGWKTLGTPPVAHAGSVRFEAEANGTTRVSLSMTYSPPAGVLGHAVAKLLGFDPKHQIDDDLVRLQSLLEIGKTTGPGGTVTKDELLTPRQ